MAGPPDALVRSLVDGPSMVSGVECHQQLPSTNVRAGEAARRGVDEGYLVVADHQTAGRGRMGRQWEAPAGTSLLVSIVLRPTVPTEVVPLLPLVTGLALAEVVDGYCPDRAVALKWPNDVLLDEGKVAGILLDRVADAPGTGRGSGTGGPGDVGGTPVVLGVGVNVDWRGVEPEGGQARWSLAEAVGAGVDRWRVLAGLAGVLSRRYEEWHADPTGFLPAYRDRCHTIGRRVRVDVPNGDVVTGHATGVADDGRLVVVTERRQTVELAAGDVTHVRPG